MKSHIDLISSAGEGNERNNILYIIIKQVTDMIKCPRIIFIKQK